MTKYSRRRCRIEYTLENRISDVQCFSRSIENTVSSSSPSWDDDDEEACRERSRGRPTLISSVR